LGNPARRAHLIVDVQVAEDLGVRRGDSVAGRTVNTPEHRAATAKCIAEMKAEIVRRHDVSADEVSSLVGARELWIDLVAVFLPMLPLYLLGSHLLARRLIAGQSPEQVKVAGMTLLFLTPVVAAVGVATTGQLAWLVEYLRSGNEHISFRASYLPHARHGWLLWGIGMILYAVVAVRALRLAPRSTSSVRR
jgi:hypothetical protein